MKAEIALLAMDMMDYTAINVGTKELLLGIDFLVEESRKVDIPFVSSNLESSNHPEIVHPFVIEKAGRIKVGIIGALSDTAFQRNGSVDEFAVSDPVRELERWIPHVRKEADFVVLLSSMNYADTQKILQSLNQKPDMIISCNPLDEDVPEPALDEPFLLTGSKGKTLGYVQVSFDRASGRFSIRKNEQVHLGHDIPDDEEILSKIDEKVDEDRKDRIRKRAARMHKELSEGLKMTPKEFMRQNNKITTGRPGVSLHQGGCK
jgi:2',3'-cyclic-nucleotide 2'-phosphodiesterase (5'-nucleotidase family)